MQIIEKTISIYELKLMSETMFGKLVKAVVDIERNSMAIDFDSMINIRPSQGNKSRYVENTEIREKIIHIVDQLVQK